jgi:CO/xanthine dehydrogenase Mo-binding subunit
MVTGSRTFPFYRCDNIDWAADVVYTNMLNAAAYRGYGATQANFAMAVTMDEMAHAIGMDPVDFWLMNTRKQGETVPVFAPLSETKLAKTTMGSCALPECIQKGAEIFGWREKRELYEKQSDGPVRCGAGMACVMHATTVPMVDMASASAKMNEDGSFNLLVGAADIGTGADTVLSQIFAETLDIPLEDVVILSSDTDVTPFDKGAYASATTYVSGMAVLKVAEEIKKQVLKVASEILEEPVGNLRLENKHVVSSKSNERVEFERIAKRALYERGQFQIGATSSAFSHLAPTTFAAHFVEVAVDTETGHVRVLNYVAAVDCGTAIHPKLAEGQVEGSILNGISYALTEEFFFDQSGRVLNPFFDSYKIFSAKDIPKMKIVFVPSYEPTGPYGAKSIGEPNIDGPLPAISNAILNAIGIRLTETPFSPERVLRAIKEREKGR